MMQIKNKLKNKNPLPEFYLKQNYPNPFKSKTSFEYSLPHKTKVVIIVIDSEGDIIKKHIAPELDAGIYRAEFEPNGLVEGTYFYQLIAGNHSGCMKMELIR